MLRDQRERAASPVTCPRRSICRSINARTIPSRSPSRPKRQPGCPERLRGLSLGSRCSLGHGADRVLARAGREASSALVRSSGCWGGSTIGFAALARDRARAEFFAPRACKCMGALCRRGFGSATDRDLARSIERRHESRAIGDHRRGESSRAGAPRIASSTAARRRPSRDSRGRSRGARRSARRAVASGRSGRTCASSTRVSNCARNEC